jgi:chaperonin GroES
MALKPLHDRVIVKRLEEENKTAGGIIIPDNNKEKPSTGEVVSVGPGKLDNGSLVELTVKPGHKVYFSKYAGTELKDGAQDLIIMKEDDILAIIE